MTTRLVDEDEWYRWLHGRQGGDRLDRWGDARPALRDWTAADLVSPTGSARTDAMQAALVDLAQGGDGDAAWLLLVQLRPGLTRLVRWVVACRYHPWAEAADEVRAVFFETVYRHSLERRPTRIAANLILDTRQRLHRAGRRQTVERAVAGGAAFDFDEPPVGTATAVSSQRRAAIGGDAAWNRAAVVAIRRAADRLPGSRSSRDLTIALAYRAWVLDQSRETIAAEAGLAKGNVTIRLHRLRAALDRDDLCL